MITRTLLLAVLLFTQLARATPQDGRDEMFPAKPAAQSAIHWKDRYFVINGKPTFISSGSIHYARVPRELWRDRIWRLKMMGFNTVQSYVFWNASEPKEGQWDFSDNNEGRTEGGGSADLLQKYIHLSPDQPDKRNHRLGNHRIDCRPRLAEWPQCGRVHAKGAEVPA